MRRFREGSTHFNKCGRDGSPTHLTLAATRFEKLGEDGRVGVGVITADDDEAVEVQSNGDLETHSTFREGIRI